MDVAIGLAGATKGISRAHLSWDAKALWVMTTSTGKILCVSMDGMTVTDYSNAIKRADHDFTPLPDGAIATIIGRQRGHGAPRSVVEMKPDGTLTTVVADLATLYRPASHPNAIHYYPADDSYTLSDRDARICSSSSSETARWSGSSAARTRWASRSRSWAWSPWKVNHGHHLTPDGRFLFFNNGGTTGDGDMPRALEVMLDETNNTATKTWEYASSGNATALGDAERLPNGNALVTNSMVGADPGGRPLRQRSCSRSRAASFGYVDFRTSLYGPPPR